MTASVIPTVRCQTCASVVVIGLPHSCPPPRDDAGTVEPTTFYAAPGLLPSGDSVT